MKSFLLNAIRECVKVAVKVFGVLALVMATIMILQYVNLLQFNPESSTTIPELKQSLLADKDNADLQNYVRDLDLLSRRAWFVGQEQLQRGGMILFSLVGGLLVGIFLLNATAEKKVKIEELTGGERAARALRWSLSVLGLSVCAVVIALSQWGDMSHLRQLMAGLQSEPKVDDAVVATAPAAPEEPAIAYATQEELSKQWMQFRGPLQNSQGLADSLFTDWSVEEDKNILWKSKISLSGFSSPIMWGDKIFLTGGDKTERKLFCYDATSGAMLWEHAATDIPNSPAEAPKVTNDTGYAASTPASDGHRIFAAFATGDIIAVDMDGKRVWEKNLGVPHNPYGFATSMVATANTLLVQYDNEENQCLYLFDSATGKEIWKKSRDVSTSWSTPIIAPLEGEEQAVVLVTSTTVEAYDYKTGAELWNLDIMGGEVAVAPIYVDGKIIVANDNATAASIDLKTGKVLWESTDFDLPDVSTPVVTDGMIILCTSGGIIEGVDLETGELLWEFEAEYGFYNSILQVGKQMIVFDMEGTAHIFEVSKEEYIPVTTKRMNELVVAMPIAGKDKLWVRSKDHLYCFGLSSTEGE